MALVHDEVRPTEAPKECPVLNLSSIGALKRGVAGQHDVEGRLGRRLGLQRSRLGLSRLARTSVDLNIRVLLYCINLLNLLMPARTMNDLHCNAVCWLDVIKGVEPARLEVANGWGRRTELWGGRLEAVS